MSLLRFYFAFKLDVIRTERVTKKKYITAKIRAIIERISHVYAKNTQSPRKPPSKGPTIVPKE